MPSVIPGDPGQIRAGAQRLRAAGEDAADAARTVAGAQQAAAGGWTGAAHDAFNGAVARTGARVGSLARLADAAQPLLTYADELERLQRAYAEVSVQFDAAWATVSGQAAGPPSAGLDRARSHLEAHSAAMDDLLHQARAANERAAAAVAEVARAATDELEGAQQELADGALTRGAALNGSDAVGRMLATAPAGVAGYELVSENMRRGARLGSDAIWGAKWAGTVAAPALSGLGQAVEDASNPYYSTGERVGRVLGQGVSVGGAALAGGVAGAAVGSIVPGPGTAVGAVVGAAGATVMAYFGSDWMDEHNDAIVDLAGEAGDGLGDGVQDVVAW
jgi:uncharacterized protein YukE